MHVQFYGDTLEDANCQAISEAIKERSIRFYDRIKKYGASSIWIKRKRIHAS